MMAEKVDRSCGYCLEPEEKMVNAKRLPCRHSFCLPCLRADMTTQGKITCPTCRVPLDGKLSLESLPDVEGGPSPVLCHSCLYRGVTSEAVTFCTDCKKLFCSRHHESHTDMFMSHATMSADEYERQSAEEKSRNCSRHVDSVITVACSVCLQTFCTKCLSDTGQCKNDDKHELRAVESVSKEAKERLQLKKKEVKMHQTDVGDEMKKSKESLRNLETEYKDLIELIHKHRDEQIDAIREQYEELERDATEEYRNRESELTTHLDNSLTGEMTAAGDVMSRLSRVMSSNKPVDVVKAAWELSSHTISPVKKFTVKPLSKPIASTDGKHRESEVTLKSISEPVVTSLPAAHRPPAYSPLRMWRWLRAAPL